MFLVMAMLKDIEGRTWATLKEAAEIFGVSRQHLQRLAQKGKIDALRLSGKAMLIDYDQTKFWKERFYSEKKALAKRKTKHN